MQSPKILQLPTPGTVSPFNIDLEEAIIGGILVDPAAIAKVAGRLQPEHFYVGFHQDLYRAALDLHQSGRLADLESMAQRLTDSGLLKKVGGRNKLADLVERTISAASIDLYAEALIDKHARRELTKAGESIQNWAKVDQPLAEVLDQVEQRIYQIGDAVRGSSEQSSEQIGDICVRVADRVEQGKSVGRATSLYDFDAMTSGLQPADLILIGGRTSMGKTWFLLCLLERIAAIHKLPVVFFSCEMTKEQVTTRWLSTLSGIESGRIAAGKLADHEWEKFGYAMSHLSQLPIIVDSTSDPSPEYMRSVLRKHSRDGIGMVGLDYLQLLSGKGDNRVQQLDYLSKQCKAIAKEFNTPFVALTQVAAEVDQRGGNKRPFLSDVSDCKAMVNHCDLLAFLYRDEYYNPDTPDRGLAEVIIGKNRNGPVGTIKLLFESHTGTFRNLARGRS